MRTAAIIPARFASTRFPGKPLKLIGGKAMLQHVYERVNASNLFDTVIIATDDERIYNAAKSWNAEVMMTKDTHISGTDRCEEVCAKLNNAFEVVVNVQGDEPFISKEPLEKVLALFSNPEIEIGTLIQKIKNEEEVQNPNVVKVARTVNGQALYFSRSPIPFIRDKNTIYTGFVKHIGIYAYRTSVLNKIVKLAPSSLELAESLEQLRWLENGYKIFVAETDYEMLAVDTPEDLIKAEELLNTQN